MVEQQNQGVVRILNCKPSAKTEEDWGIEAAASAGMVAAPALPAELDLREAWWEVGNQLDTGSCVGWGTGDAVIRWHLVKCNRISPTDHVSVRYLWMAAKETDEFISRPSTFIEYEGTSIKAALDVARKFGVVLDTLVPFINGRLYQGYAKDFYPVASKMRINAYYNLGTNLNTWRKWLANNGPIVTRLDVDATWNKADQTNGNLDVYLPDTAVGGHAVAIVGYRADCFIIRNSWGTEWGDQGFAYASLDYARAAFTEAYGIDVS